MPVQATPEHNAPSLTRQASWLLMAKLIGFVVMAAAPLIVVRVLSQTDFGLYKQIFLILSSSVQLLTFGFFMNLFYFLPREPALRPKIVLNVLIFHTFMGLLGMTVLLVYPRVLDSLGSSALMTYARPLAVAVALTIIGYCLEVVATANQDVKYSAAFIVAAQLTKGVAVSFVAAAFRSVSALVYAVIFQGLVQCGVLLWYLNNRFPGFIGRPNWWLMRDQFSYSMPLAMGTLALLAQTSYPQFMVARQFSAAEYAIYAVGCSNLPLIGLIRESVNAVLITRVSYLQQQDDQRGITVLLANVIRKLSFAYLPVVAFLTVAATEFIAALYTPRYVGSLPIFLINLLAIPLSLLPLDAVYRAYKDFGRFLVAMRTLSTLLLVPAVYFGIHYAGMVGSIAAVVLVMTAERCALTVRIARRLHVTKRDWVLLRDSGKIALGAFAAAIATAIFHRFMPAGRPLTTLAVMALFYFAVYMAIVILMRVLTADETEMVRRGVARFRRLVPSIGAGAH
jgi:O-antigen/teichoic acid export membrane protein